MNTGKFTSIFKRINTDVTVFFVVLSIVFGGLFALITPPFQGTDEPVHFLRAYQISEGDFTANNLAPNQSGGRLPSSIAEALVVTDTSIIRFHPDQKYDIYRSLEAMDKQLERDKRKNYDFSTAAGYAPIPYIPASAAMFIGRIFGADVLQLMYMARLANVLCWTVLVALAIRYMPNRKWALAFIGLIPMAIFQAATINADVVTIGSVMLLLGYVLHLRASKRVINLKEVALLMLISTLMVLGKQIMFVFLPLLLLLKSSNFKRRRFEYLAKGIMVTVPFIILIGWYLFNSGVYTSGGVIDGQSTSGQLSYIIHNPHSYINALWNTYFYTWGDGVTRSFIGIFGSFDAPLSEAIVVVGYILLALVLSAHSSTRKLWDLSVKAKTLVAGIAAVYFLAVTTSLYVFYSPVGYKIVYGLQGRYFLPILPLLIPLISPKWLTTPEVIYKRLVTVGPLLLLIASSITIYVRFYVNNV